MATPSDRDPETGRASEQPGRMGEGYFILGMAVQVGLVGLVGLALVGVQGFGFLTLGTAVALAGLAIGILAIGSILTLASLRHILNVVDDHGNEIDRLAQRVGALADEIRGGDEEVGWGGEAEEMDLTAQPDRPRRTREDPRDRRPDPQPGTPPDPLGEGRADPLIDVPGIDAETTERLNEMGITDTQDLWAGDPMPLADRLGRQTEEVEHWQAVAELMAVEGITGDEAARLARAGVRSVNDLEHESPERLMRRIEETENLVGGGAETVGPQQAHDWIEAARAHPTEGTDPSETREA